MSAAAANKDVPVRLLQKYRHFLLDCDGVLWHSATAIRGAREAVARIRAAGADVVFVTNNATKTREAYLAKFEQLGFAGVAVREVNTSGSAAAEYCARAGLTKVFCIGEAGVTDECRALGLEVVADDAAGPAMDDAEFESTVLASGVKAVVVGWDRHFSYRKLALASLYLQAGAALVACNPDASDKMASGRFMPGNGCQVAAIQYSVGDAAGQRTVVAGKPNGALIQALIDKYKFDRAATLMVGDRLDTDILFAQNGGVDSLLVLSGCTSREDLALGHGNSAGAHPTYVAVDLFAGLDSDLARA